MPESKSGALTNLATPLHGTIVELFSSSINPLIIFLKLQLKPNILPIGQRMAFQIATLANFPTVNQITIDV